MPYEISWLVENQVIHIVINGDVTIDTITALSKAIAQYIEISDALLVHLLIYDKAVQSSPKQILKVLNAAQVLRHSRLGWFIIYGSDNKLFKFITQMLSQLIK